MWRPPVRSPAVATFRELAPIFPVRDVAAALAHYAALGFAVSPYEAGDEYGFAERDGVQLHVSRFDGHDPLTTATSAYLYVDDADALFAEWRDAAVGGRLHAPTDTDYGLREGAHVDPEGNLIRFGSFLAGEPAGL
jgi:uncharacterized glyoxalase superfamily protein PhnB